MIQNYYGWIQHHLQVPRNLTEKDLPYYFIGILTSAFPLVFHLGLLVFFTVLQLPVLALVNLGSVGIYSFTLYAVLKQGRYLLAIVVGAIEVLIHQILMVIVLGWAAGFQYYLVTYIIAIALLPPHRRGIIITFEVLYALAFLLLATLVKKQTPWIGLDAVVVDALNIVNVVLFLALLILGMIYFIGLILTAEKKAEAEYGRAEDLLHNILPKSVAQQLKGGQTKLAERFEDVTVLFADIVGFTNISKDMDASDVVDLLNAVFTRFDELAEKHRVEKIKTIGDAYMVVAGAPDPCPDHAERVVNFALEAVHELKEINERYDFCVEVRIGINSGPAVAGVIGKKKFIYDIWGDAVNLASRLEAHGIPGQIQVGETTYTILRDRYSFSERGLITIKGKGAVPAYILETSLVSCDDHEKM